MSRAVRLALVAALAIVPVAGVAKAGPGDERLCVYYRTSADAPRQSVCAPAQVRNLYCNLPHLPWTPEC